MKIKEAVAQLGYDETPDESLCIARIKEGRIVQATLAECGERALDLLGDVFIATGAFRKGAIQAKSGRTQENLVRVMDLAFDFDLTDYLAISKDDLYASSDTELDRYLSDLREDAGEVLSRERIPVLLWISTGYGLLALSRIAVPDQGRVLDAAALHAYLVERVNYVAGFKLADPQVKDAGTRIVRLPGCVNT